MQKIKVLVVDDSVFMRNLISQLITVDTALEVIGTARNGEEAVSMVRRLKPDVITLDIDMPEMNGLEALTTIMEHRPTPIIMLSLMTPNGEIATIKALQNGAVDFISKPSCSNPFDLFKVKEELISKIKQASQIPLINLIVNNITDSKDDEGQKGNTQTGLARKFDQILVIGTSTGGPKALDTVITALPANFPYPILVVQHMPPKFTKSLADRLNRLSRVRVVEAEDNQTVLGGTVYIAPGDYHMTVVQTNGEFRIRLHQEPQVQGHRPSVDVLFNSISLLKSLKRHFILMTGMGSDGAKGMMAAKAAGAHTTITESKETCIVYGMPRSAVELGCVDYTVPVHLITSKIMEVTGFLKR
ncbi:protein-glutamate methylesterase/protein-glutamine glutaminase [Paenibacillus antarcticus]|uniref:Protein-glutamate methylesterase/protein-glutamine glutaminase n=1 Tax=Paenibacillus antarcticus TaxID=253703 RepID=A0A168Q1R2_9BACL|nr:chemotaxis response regulator protein-glutamate methylesterase [Paenibacillus antarcticus]OAB47293.1 chemotaxis response regulator protein-glutamate methylesterase [Paenibacillus antarcticus]